MISTRVDRRLVGRLHLWEQKPSTISKKYHLDSQQYLLVNDLSKIYMYLYTDDVYMCWFSFIKLKYLKIQLFCETEMYCFIFDEVGWPWMSKTTIWTSEHSRSHSTYRKTLQWDGSLGWRLLLLIMHSIK